MSATRLVFPSFLAALLALVVALGVQLQGAAAEVVGARVPPPLAAAIKADVEARGYKYGGDCKFDAMYLAPGMWCSFVESISSDGAAVNYGRFASDEMIKVTFERQGEYGWVNPATGVASPSRVPVLSAQFGATPDSWVIEAINFPASTVIGFFDGSGCGGEQRCPTDHTLGQVETSPDGWLRITVQFDPGANPVPGQVNRLLQATGGAFIQLPYHHAGAAPTPTVIVGTPPAPPPTAVGDPAPVIPTPAAPAAGDKTSDGTNVALYSAVALFGLTTAGALGVML